MTIQPLTGVRVVEFEGLGPAPMAGHLLAGMGASVTLIARPSAGAVQSMFGAADDADAAQGTVELERLKRRVVLDLKSSDGRARALDLLIEADALIEGLRPGVMERLGLGPADCARINPRLVYGRMTGWGQQGPLAQAAGHDLNYVALSGMLSLSARPGQLPIAAPTVTGDAPGALALAFGMACALLRARSSGEGCIVDAAIVDVAAMMGLIAQWIAASGNLSTGQAGESPAPSPFHDSPFYEVYECADGRFITVGALEPAFYAQLLQRLGLGDIDPAAQYDRSAWPVLKARFQALFLQRTQAEWCAVLEGTDACFAPVLTLAEAARHPHNVARGTFTARDGGLYADVVPKMAPLAPAREPAD